MTKKLEQASKERHKGKRVHFADAVESSSSVSESAESERADKEGQINTMTRGKKKELLKKKQAEALLAAPSQQ